MQQPSRGRRRDRVSNRGHEHPHVVHKASINLSYTTTQRDQKRVVAHPVAHLDHRSIVDADVSPVTEVELRGIEPLTSSMPWKRSAN
jgi:hypothetical protein